MHPITDAQVEAFVQRMGYRWTLEEARARAEQTVQVAVENALLSGSVALDTIQDPGLEQVARARWRERVAAGESASEVVQASSGAPISPRRRSRAAQA